MMYNPSSNNQLPGGQRPEEYVASIRPESRITGPVQPLSGGNLNCVWRIPADPKSFILKYAPPFVAAQPDIPLSDTRIDFEAAALILFRPGGRLETAAGELIRPPECYHYDAGRKLLLMEDFGPVPGLFENGRIPEAVADSLGRFIAALHRQTMDDTDLASRFNNAEVQRSRQAVQYEAAGDFLEQADIPADPQAVANARALGRFLLGPGRCLVMGDLWPPSVLISHEGKTGIIDWEFVHFGQPLQDVAHFVAHYELQAAAVPESHQAILAFKNRFIHAYRQSLGSAFDVLYDDPQLRHFNVHVAMELLMRTFGPFKAGYVFADHPPDHPTLHQLARRAHELLKKPGNYKGKVDKDKG
jgi:5-methylthioribose kinase